MCLLSGTRTEIRIIHVDQFRLTVRRSKRTSSTCSSERIIRLVSILIIDAGITRRTVRRTWLRCVMGLVSVFIPDELRDA